MNRIRTINGYVYTLKANGKANISDPVVYKRDVTILKQTQNTHTHTHRAREREKKTFLD